MNESGCPADYALFHCRLAKAEILIDTDQLDFATREIWGVLQVICHIKIAEVSDDLVNILVLKCRRNSILQSIVRAIVDGNQSIFF